jgi:putative nucleotidyltransferase with HDIG domain
VLQHQRKSALNYTDIPEPEDPDFLTESMIIKYPWLTEEVRKLNRQISEIYDAFLEGWILGLELRDFETRRHAHRVAKVSVELAQSMGVEESDIMYLNWGALLHDIGKIGIPDEILLKPGPLTPEEWDIMKKHTQYAYEMLSRVSFLGPAVEIPFFHHEKWDGTGYPNGLKGEQIPLAARIFAVIDVWDALNSERPYREDAWPKEEIIQYLKDQAGKHFDPKVVEYFLKYIEKHSP